MSDICIEDFIVRTWDVDRGDKFTPYAAFNFFQEVAGNHARELGVGTETLRETGLTWVLSRMSAVLDKRPGWGSRIQVKSWPRGTERLFAIRDYLMLDEDGTAIARGRSAWLIIDLATLRPRRPEAFAEGLPKNEGLEALRGGAQGLAVKENLIKAGERVASYSDIDYNGHVNNARYVQWIQDILPPEDLEAASSMRVDINYLSEVKPGNTVGLFAVPFEVENSATRHFAVEGRQGETGTPSFRAEVSLEK